MRSTTVLTKSPTTCRRATVERVEIGQPIGMSVPAPKRVSKAANAACSTMNTETRARCARRISGTCTGRSISTGMTAPRKLAVAGRG